MNIYLAGTAVLMVALFVGASYVQGRNDGIASVKAAQLDAYKNAVDDSIKELGLRATADQAARLDAERFSTRVRKDLAKVREDFNALPQVIVRNGCPDLSDSFRMRWNSAEHAASDLRPSASGGEPVRDDSVPVAQ